MPRFHNPLGSSYSKTEKQEILHLAHLYDVYIVIDDYLADFEYNSKNDPLFAEGTHDRVIYVKSFSKIMFPGLRIGVAVIPCALIETFQQIKKTTDIDSSMISQAALTVYLKSGMFKHFKEKNKQCVLRTGKNFTKVITDPTTYVRIIIRDGHA